MVVTDNNGQVCRVCLQFSLCSLATTKMPLKYKDFGGFGGSGCRVVRPLGGVNFRGAKLR